MPIESKKLKVEIDTNVFISGLNFTGNSREILKLLRMGEIDVCISPFILDEMERVLVKKFSWGEKQIGRVLNLIRKQTLLVRPKLKVSLIKEKDDDNRILECAVEANANFLISGDKRHLLPLKKFEGIKIISPADFLKMF